MMISDSGLLFLATVYTVQ